MILMHPLEVLVILGVLAGARLGVEAELTPCNFTVKSGVVPTVNCSKRNFDVIPAELPQQIYQLDPDEQVLVTFFDNTITNITRLPKIPSSHVAINFKHNLVTEIVPSSFSDVPGVRYLDLSNNLLTGEVLRSEIFQGPYNGREYGNIALESLYLGHNDIHSLDGYLFQYTPNLTRLYLNDNPIEILDRVTIIALSSAINLEVLDLSNTSIDSIPLDAFRGLLNLRQIDLSGNQFVTVPESLQLLGNTLEYLTFNDNPITELNDDSFVGLVKLKQLEVGDNDYLAEVKRSTFTPLKSLESLHLCHNRNLRYISHNAFRGMKDKWTLTEVYLDYNNLSELSADLMPWAKLETLGMTGNNWLCNCDLANIVTIKGAGQKFKEGQIPICAAPMKLSGEYITNITLNFCPTFDNTVFTNKTFCISDLKPKHILWSIFGVAFVVCIGMLFGLLINAIKTFYNNKFRSQPIRYINLKDNTSFA